MRHLGLALASLLLVAACSKATMPKQGLPQVERSTVEQPLAGARLPEIEISKLTRDLPNKTFFGIVEATNSCNQSIDLHQSWTVQLLNSRMEFEFMKDFVDTLRAEGYQATSYQHTTLRPSQPEIQVAASFIDLLFNFCVAGHKVPITFISPGLDSKADAYLKVRWTLFDVSSRQILATIETEGTGSVPQFTTDGNMLTLKAAFRQATRNLLADPTARRIFSGQGDS